MSCSYCGGKAKENIIFPCGCSKGIHRGCFVKKYALSEYENCTACRVVYVFDSISPGIGPYAAGTICFFAHVFALFAVGALAAGVGILVKRDVELYVAYAVIVYVVIYVLAVLLWMGAPEPVEHTSDDGFWFWMYMTRPNGSCHYQKTRYYSRRRSHAVVDVDCDIDPVGCCGGCSGDDDDEGGKCKMIVILAAIAAALFYFVLAGFVSYNVYRYVKMARGAQTVRVRTI